MKKIVLLLVLSFSVCVFATSCEAQTEQKSTSESQWSEQSSLSFDVYTVHAVNEVIDLAYSDIEVPVVPSDKPFVADQVVCDTRTEVRPVAHAPPNSTCEYRRWCV